MTLDINGGMRIGQLTTAEVNAITCDANKLGTLIFDTDENRVKVCKSTGWSIFNPNCGASTEIVGGHTYNVSAIDDGLSDVVTSVAYAISNGQATSDQTFVCNGGTVETSGGETQTATSCNSGYSPIGDSCVLVSWNASWGKLDVISYYKI